VEEALIEMYLAGVSVRRVEDITEALWGTKVSPSTISELNKKVYTHIEDWRNRPIEGDYPYVYLMGTATGTKAIAMRMEGLLPIRLQYLRDRLLDKPVQYGRNTQLALAPIRLGDLDPTHRLGTVRPRQ